MRIRFLLPLFMCVLCFGKAYTQNVKSDLQNGVIVDIAIPVKLIDTGNEKYDNRVYTRDVIKYLREDYNLPAYTDNGNKDLDIKKFNAALKDWHKEYTEFYEILPLRIFSEFWLYDETCYPKTPELTEKNANFYDILFEKWMIKHPEDSAPIGNISKSGVKQKKSFTVNIINNNYCDI